MVDAALTRFARLIVCDEQGIIRGTTPDFTVPSPYWSHVEPLVSAAEARLGLAVTVLRLAAVERGSEGEPDHTTYVVEAEEPAGLSSASDEDRRVLRPHALRMPWAEPGGSTAQLAWAEQELAARGIPLTSPAVQVRTWNLSSIWRLPTTGGTVWLKAVPPFFAHEGAVIEAFAGLAVPRLLARRDGVCLMADAAGDDLYEPADDQACAMIDALMGIQRGHGADVDALRALGLPDWRVPRLAAPAAHTIELRAGDLDRDERRALDDLIAGFDARERALDSCGIPETLAHGDFHPGNVRGSGVDVTILDWGDSGIGHPFLDLAAFTERMPQAQRDVVQAHWTQRWNTEVPGSDPSRAAALITPIAALRQAVIYRHFLDHIEPDERVYHATDDLLWLRRTAELLQSE